MQLAKSKQLYLDSVLSYVCLMNMIKPVGKFCNEQNFM